MCLSLTSSAEVVLLGAGGLSEKEVRGGGGDFMVGFGILGFVWGL